jgi:2-oxoisovalerate dehydrogenase E1 component
MINVLNRAEIIDHGFTEILRKGEWATPRTAHSSDVTWEQSGLTRGETLELFESQVICRHLDLLARILKNKDLCYYTIGSAGHEGNAVFGKVFRHTDMAFLHYRSAAFMIQRSRHLPNSTPIYDTLLSFVASSEDPIAGGRHKVFGSKPLFVPPQTSTIASHLPKSVGAAFSIARARDLQITTAEIPDDSVILCSFGDASANHSTAQGAFNSCSWAAYQHIPMPLVFICEDNGIGISVRTPNNWIESSFAERPALKYIACDGLNIFDLHLKAREAEAYARTRRRPVFLHMKTARLLGHAGSDMELSYRTQEQIDQTETHDPLLATARLIIDAGLASAEELLGMYESVREQVRAVSERAIARPKLLKASDVRASITACADPKIEPVAALESQREALWGRDYAKLGSAFHMAKLINIGLHDILLRYPNTLVFGEDVAQKGGVYNVTDGLHKRFGAKRVFNSLLDEQSILGTAIGVAHNGFLPIPEIQFLAYVHNAEDQIRGEAATLAFFSEGKFTNPMVVRIAGLPYQKGFGGHFHNDNSLAVFRDIPGLIVAVPSNGRDAVLMMRRCVREAYEKGRVVIFVEPIALYMTKDLYQDGDKAWSFEYPADLNEEIEIGEFGIFGGSAKPGGGSELADDLVIVTYGNGTYLSLQAAQVLEQKHGVKAKIIDLRWIAPIDVVMLAAELKSARHVLIVDECRKTGSLSEFLVASLVENLKPLPKIQVLAADDCFIPLGKAAAAGLPKKEEIYQACVELLKL